MTTPARGSYTITRLSHGQKHRNNSLLESMKAAKGETWLFVTPHDDDLCLGAGLLMQAAAAEGVDVQVVIVSDGRMGYCSLEQRDSIVDIRRKEAYASFEMLGVPRASVQYVAIPDAILWSYKGRRKHRHDDEAQPIEGYVGLQNAFTYHLRRTRPARVFVPTSADLHPDHQVVHSELMISLFHAGGNIWPELGEQLADVPQVYELAVYCDFPEPPAFEIKADEKLFERKLQSIAAYQSQTQISRLVEQIRKAGPVEYVRELNFRFYTPDNYKHLFA